MRIGRHQPVKQCSEGSPVRVAEREREMAGKMVESERLPFAVNRVALHMLVHAPRVRVW